MKKKFLFSLIFVLGCFSLQAKRLFVEMEFHKNSIKLNDGSNKKSQLIKAEDGEELKFTSFIGALNYVSLQGWELVDTKTVTQGAPIGGNGATDTKVYYILSKEVPDNKLETVVKNSYKK